MNRILVLLIIYTTTVVDTFILTPKALVKSLCNKSIKINKCNLQSSRKVNYNAVTLLRSCLHNNKSNKCVPPIGYVPYRHKNPKIIKNIDEDIELLFEDDVLLTDIKRETLYIRNKFDKLLNDIDHMKKTVENIKKHNEIVNTKTDYYNID
tara:strand:+ start:6010 stop:6462 length:453 start_codon:yes stop_codon:yes gene_type:complete